MRLVAAAFFCAAILAAGRPAAAEKIKPLVSVFGTCASLTTNTYPADSQNWFDGTKQSQVVFYAHLLYPTRPEEGPDASVSGPWHPSLRITPTAQAVESAPFFNDEFYAQAEWLDPDNKRVAFYGLTFPARIRSDYVQLQGRWYAPHTFAMAIGTRDQRGDAGQTRLPDKVGQYTVRFSADGRPLGVAFFRMLKAGMASGASEGLGTGKAAAALSLSSTGKAMGLSLPAGVGIGVEP